MMIDKQEYSEEGKWRTCEDKVELLVDKIASTDDLLSWPESEIILLFLLDKFPPPLDLLASAARSHICNSRNNS